jgi:hypothetical protein
VLITDGTDSYRLAQATAGKGVTPLACASRSALGRTDGHQRGQNMAAIGENRWPPLGKNRWPLTGRDGCESLLAIEARAGV